MIAKLQWPRLRRRRSGGRAVKDSVLTGGDLASCLKGRRRKSERGVSRGRSSRQRTVGEGLNERESETTVVLDDAAHQPPARAGSTTKSRGEAPRARRGGEASTAGHGDERSGSDDLMERVVARGNMRAAWKRVKGNGGSPGVDGMTVEEAPAYLKAQYPFTARGLRGGEQRRCGLAAQGRLAGSGHVVEDVAALKA
jgi:hypothetical protein